jgi:hypothetical protein
MGDDAKHARPAPATPADERWDSDPAWASARERAREEVDRVFAPRARACPECGHEAVTASRRCPKCGSSYVQWRRGGLSRRIKLAIAATVVLIAAGGTIAGIVLSPGIERGKRERAGQEARAQAAFIAAETRRLRSLQRLHRGRAARAGEGPAALVLDLERAIGADARQRVARHLFHGPIVQTSCQPVKLGPLVPGPARGGYECNAINAHVIANGSRDAGEVGYPFWAIVDYRRGSFSWCAITPPSGEGATRFKGPAVPPPSGCDLGI